jgi:hypothetical protein
MTVDLNVLDHLADGLYSSVAAVLTETVANAWDADAKEVRIELDIGHDRISIFDDGIGMDKDSINYRYLRVGYHRREERDITLGGRAVMGRKGIGKLSLFSIANTIEIRSESTGSQPIGLRIKASELRVAMKEKRSVYNPEPLLIKKNAIGNGTKIIVTGLKKKRIHDMSSESLRRRLARRFSIIGSSNFRVYVDNTEVTSADRDDLKFVEYLWVIGKEEPDVSICENLKQTEYLDDSFDGWNKKWKLKGWIGTVDRPKSLATSEGNLNSVVVLARGRLVDEDVLPRISGAEVYTKYLTGQVEADFLDETNEGDIVTSNRQRVIEDDERMTALVAFLRKQMRLIADAWSGLRAKDKTSELRTIYPNIGKWLDTLQDGWKAKAEKLLERIATMEVGKNDSDTEESQRTLLRHAIFGFERLRLRGDAEELEQALEKGVEELLRLLAGRDSLEASLYRDIIGNRLEVIKELENLVDVNSKEKVLQKYLFNHLWILDPSWERATENAEMEKRLKLRDPFKNDQETKNKYGRIDIHYRALAGKHAIVELKRASVNTGIYDLGSQGAKYVDALREVLPVDERDRANIEVVFVVGENSSEPPDRISSVMNGVSPGSRIKTYEQLVLGARSSYAEYLESARKVDIIDNLLMNKEKK